MADWDTIIKDKAKEEEKKKRETVEKKQREQGELKGSEVKLILDAKEILGKYLVEKFQAYTAGYPALTPFLQNFGPYILKYTVRTYSSQKDLRVGWTESIRKSNLEALCQKIVGLDGNFVQDLDFFRKQEQGAAQTTDDCIQSADFDKIFPEKVIVEKIMMGSQTQNINSAYDAVMTMVPELRPVMAIAIARSWEYRQQNGIVPNSRNDLVRANTTSLDTVLQVAKEYGVQDLKPIIQEYNKSMGLF